MQLIVVENQLNPGVLSPTELNKLVESLELYAKDINHSPWVEHGYCSASYVKLLSKGESFPKGAYNLILLDEISLEGALGYHEDEDGGKIPVSYVPVKEIREDDATVSEVATHELGEMIVNPFVSQESEMRTVKHDNKEYIVEIADPVQEVPYRLFNGELGANFVWPIWFGMSQTRKWIDQTSYVTGNSKINSQFELSDTGYISIKEEGKEWQPEFGEKRTKLPKWSSRLRHAGAA